VRISDFLVERELKRLTQAVVSMRTLVRVRLLRDENARAQPVLHSNRQAEKEKRKAAARAAVKGQVQRGVAHTGCRCTAGKCRRQG
jgi:hypothetical protein